jgi:pimeloyl-ACP methyl ester carboxylesterase
LSSQQRIAAFERYWLAFDNAQTVSIHQGLQRLKIPTLIVWGLADIFFDVKWAYWLQHTIPGAERVIEVADGRLFFSEDRPKSLSEPLLGFWG